MEEKKTIFEYLTQVMVIFGFSMLILNLFCLVVGNSAKDISAIFELGNQGISVKIVFQFLVVSALIVGARILFFTDFIIKKMPIWLRTICMLIVVVIVITIFVILFHWFPVNAWQPWVMFFVCFGISFLVSYFVMILKEKAENKLLEEALCRLKEKEEDKK